MLTNKSVDFAMLLCRHSHVVMLVWLCKAKGVVFVGITVVSLRKLFHLEKDAFLALSSGNTLGELDFVCRPIESFDSPVLQLALCR